MFPTEDFSLEGYAIISFVIQMRYLIIAGLAFFIVYKWNPQAWASRKLQAKMPKNKDFIREIGYSTLTTFIFAAFALFILFTPIVEYTQVYEEMNAHGWLWFFFSLPVMLVVHDTYFYWTHRLMHHPKLFKTMHLVHHKSHNPSPWAAFSFHPLEAIVEAGIMPVLLFSMPVHPIMFTAFVLIMTMDNVYGHLGYEIYPKWLYKHSLTKWINSGTHHNEHHVHSTGNYGLYFLFWDTWMGTLRSDTQQKFDAVTSNGEQAKMEKNPTKTETCRLDKSEAPKLPIQKQPQVA